MRPETQLLCLLGVRIAAKVVYSTRVLVETNWPIAPDEVTGVAYAVRGRRTVSLLLQRGLRIRPATIVMLDAGAWVHEDTPVAAPVAAETHATRCHYFGF